MESEKIELPSQLMSSIRAVVKKTKLYKNEEDFIYEAIIKQISKHK